MDSIDNAFVAGDILKKEDVDLVFLSVSTYLMGSYYGGIMDIYTDLTDVNVTFCGHMEIIEVNRLSALKLSVTEGEVDHKVRKIREIFDVLSDCSAEAIKRAAKTAVALDKMIAEYQLGAFAYYHKGTANTENEDTMSSVILDNSLLIC